MLNPRLLIWLFLPGLLGGGVGTVCAQSYPTKPIRIVTSAAGGNNDLIARMIGAGISSALGQPVLIDNRNAVAGGEMVSKAPPDGYTLLLFGSTLWIGPLLQPSPFGPLTDFAPITLASTAPLMLVVHPSLPVNSVKELIALIKTKPGEFNYSFGSRGTSPHLAVELFKAMTGVTIVAVPYKGNIPGLNALLAGEVQIVFPTAATGGPFVKSGKLRALAVTSAEPSALFPGAPTVAASDLPGYESVSITGMFAPARTPDAIIKRLNQEIVRFISQPDVKEKFLNTGSEVIGSTPQEFAGRIKFEMTRMGKVIKDANIRADWPQMASGGLSG